MRFQVGQILLFGVQVFENNHIELVIVNRAGGAQLAGAEQGDAGEQPGEYVHDDGVSARLGCLCHKSC